MVTIGPLLYGALSCFKKSPLNFTTNLALGYIRHAANLLLDVVVVKLNFSLASPLNSHEEILLPSLSKYLFAG